MLLRTAFRSSFRYGLRPPSLIASTVPRSISRLPVGRAHLTTCRATRSSQTPTAEPTSSLAHREALSAYLLTTYTTTSKLVGTFGLAAAIAVPLGGLIGAFSPVALGACWATCGIFPLMALWRMESKHPAAPTIVINEADAVYTCTIPSGRMRTAHSVMASLGAFSSPAIVAISALSPVILPAAIALTVGCFGGATFVASRAPSESLLQWQAPLSAAVFGIAGLGIVNISAALLGFHAFTDVSSLVSATVSIGVFTALSAVEAHVILHSYREKLLDPVGHGIGLALDVVNILLAFLRVLASIHESLSED
jgi:hypothetical protein